MVRCKQRQIWQSFTLLKMTLLTHHGTLFSIKFLQMTLLPQVEVYHLLVWLPDLRRVEGASSFVGPRFLIRKQRIWRSYHVAKNSLLKKEQKGHSKEETAGPREALLLEWWGQKGFQERAFACSSVWAWISCQPQFSWGCYSIHVCFYKKWFKSNK